MIPSMVRRELTMDVEETAESRIQRQISENPVVIFTRPACCMCHVMKRLLCAVGVHPTVIQLDDSEIPALPPSADGGSSTPAVFIGGASIGGLESLVALHLSGLLVPKLLEIGALKDTGIS
ncbi:glutaredoxin-C6-like [Diospyros lotus]|uniref:glutaredoxin-C6-like n=1 Tax=Diospyros lotus TaxID=55363 RepID=UPI00224D5D34|nr:glutaredoxin-C6-like [Diospyros lotus]